MSERTRLETMRDELAAEYRLRSAKIGDGAGRLNELQRAAAAADGDIDVILAAHRSMEITALEQALAKARYEARTVMDNIERVEANLKTIENEASAVRRQVEQLERECQAWEGHVMDLMLDAVGPLTKLADAVQPLDDNLHRQAVNARSAIEHIVRAKGRLRTDLEVRRRALERLVGE